MVFQSVHTHHCLVQYTRSNQPYTSLHYSTTCVSKHIVHQHTAQPRNTAYNWLRSYTDSSISTDMILSRLLCLIALVLVTSAAVIDGRAPGKAPKRPKTTTPVKPVKPARPARTSKPAKPVATPKQPKGPTPPKPALNVAKVLTFQCQDMPGNLQSTLIS